MIRVRQARLEDLPRMMEIARHSVTAAQWKESHYQAAFSAGRMLMVIEENNLVMGFLVGVATAGEWEIENIAVAGAARRRGLGTHLLGEFLHHIRDTGGREVALEVRESNHAARALYEKWAFFEAGRRKSYFCEPVEDALVMKFIFPEQS